MPIEMRRFNIPGMVENPGLEFDRFMPDWQENSTQRGEQWSGFLDQISMRSMPAIYQQAYERWLNTLQQTDQISVWFATVQGKLMTGTGLPHPLETQISRNRLYGMPMLPGSGLKGLTRAWACRYSELGEDEIAVLFGRGGDDDSSESGYLIFHDAWWVPDSGQPYCKEVVTVHHQEYYSSEGVTPATDFDSPNPSFQLATRGSFVFAIEGARPWADLAMEVLQRGLEYEGYGGKVSAGYGRFEYEEGDKKRLKSFEIGRNKTLERIKEDIKKIEEKEADKDLSAEQKILRELRKQAEGLKTASLQAEKEAVSATINKILDEGLDWSTDMRQQAAELIRGIYDEKLGWHRPGTKKSIQKKKQREKKEKYLQMLLQGRGK